MVANAADSDSVEHGIKPLHIATEWYLLHHKWSCWWDCLFYAVVVLLEDCLFYVVVVLLEDCLFYAVVILLESVGLF